MIRYADNSFVSDPGDPIQIVYSPTVNEDGTIDLVETGKIDLDAQIQSYKESTDIRTILARCAEGDMSGLNVRTPLYGDFTKMPKTYAEALQLKIDADNLFYSLPPEIRQKFDNDTNKFFAQSGTQEWYENIEGVLPEDVKNTLFPPAEVAKEESRGEE